MKIAIIGATGFVGSHIVKEGLDRGLDIVAIARNTSKLELSDPKLVKKDIDIANEEDLIAALKGADLVVSAFNAGWQNPNIYQDFMTGAQQIETAVEKSGIKRFIVIGGAGSLFVNGVQLVDTPSVPVAIKPGATAARDYFNIIKENITLDWTFFSPAPEMHRGITTGRTGKYRTGTDSPVFDTDGRSVLSVEDLSVAIIDEVKNPHYIRQRFTAAY